MNTLKQELNDIATALLTLLFYFLILLGAYHAMEPAPGNWSFVLAYLFGLPVAWWAMRAVGATSLRHPYKSITETQAFGAAVLLALLSLLDARPHVSGSYLTLPAGLIGAVVLAVWEEAMFRGVILPAFAKRYGLFVGMGVSAMLSAGFYLRLGAGSAATSFIVGLALGALYIRNGLGACLAFHGIFNALAGPIFGLQLGGIPWPGLLEPSVQRDPLEYWPVQLGLIILLLLWIPYKKNLKQSATAPEQPAAAGGSRPT